MRLDMHSREEVVKGNYKDYQSATKKGKNKILARLVPVCGMNRDYLAHKLSTYKDQAEVVIDGKTVILKKCKKKRGVGKHGGRPPKYDAVFVKVLTAIWSDHGQQCGKERPSLRPFASPIFSPSARPRLFACTILL
ncbi:MAG: hypothetical protein Ta2F_17520 [Termitinemataceae bacterium]|nr:MAG: hypothetical protein Ta2F_17520 [Termitinemataceae bacterium]